MRRTVIITALVVILTSVGLIIFVRLTSHKENEALDFAEVKRGTFEIAVSSSGELISENSFDIKGPNLVQNMNFRPVPVKITDLVPEGTIVRKGEYIGSLDRTSFNNTLKDETDILKKLQSDFEMKLFDTAVTLSVLRDDIKNQYFISEEAAIVVEQSKYEPPATQRMAMLELDKSKRYLEYKQRLYNLRYSQSSAEIRNLKSSVLRQQKKVNDLNDVLTGFTITAPYDGMVIYKKERTGLKRKAGSFINPFDNVVATLPDLSSMLSRIYVSEVDVSKVKPGQPVEMTIDAFQGKAYNGTIASVGNIGEQLSNSDSRVFEVLVRLNETYPLLRPSMTTGNRIITKVFRDVVYIPVESVQAGIDTIPYVYTKEGTRQVVILGESNDKNIIVEQGLESGSSVFLTTPVKPWKFTLAGNELITIIKEREKARKLELEKIRKENYVISEYLSPWKEIILVPTQTVLKGEAEGL